MELSMEKLDDLIKVYDEKNESWKFVKRDKGFNKQLMMVEDTLSRFGLLKNEIRVYVYLARAGERKAAEVAEAISLHRTETYRILRDLEKKGIVFSVFEKPLEVHSSASREGSGLAHRSSENENQVLGEGKSLGWSSFGHLCRSRSLKATRREIFQILEGGQQILLKANELLERARREIQIFAPGEYLGQLYHSDFIDNLEVCSKKLDIALLTENSLKGRFFLDKMSWAGHKHRVVDVKNIPCFIISDRNELLIAIQQNEEGEDGIDKKKSKTVALWTNYNAFIETLEMLFSKLNETAKTVQEICLRR